MSALAIKAVVYRTILTNVQQSFLARMARVSVLNSALEGMCNAEKQMEMRASLLQLQGKRGTIVVLNDRLKHETLAIVHFGDKQHFVGTIGVVNSRTHFADY